MTARRAIPDPDTILRFISATKFRVDPETGAYLGLSPAAFAMREDDAGHLSVTWLEYFDSDGLERIRNAARAHGATLRTGRLPANGGFASASVLSVKHSAERYKKRVRVVHAPVAGNDGHAEVRHFTDDDIELLDELATEVFADEAGIFMVRDLGI